MKEKILIIEDEEKLIRGLRVNLVREGYEVIWALDGEEGLNMALRETPDLILLDVMLPHKDGLDVCRELRGQNVFTPVIMLTAKSEEVDKVVGLQIGADDYITKPFSVSELLARIKAHLRRSTRAEKCTPMAYRFDDVEIDFAHFKVLRCGREFSLTPFEAEILKYFVSHRGEVVTRDTLLNKIWGYKRYPSTRTVDNHILKLRKKIEEDSTHPKYLISIYGQGYRFMGGP